MHKIVNETEAKRDYMAPSWFCRFYSGDFISWEL